LKSQVVQVETCTDMALLRSSRAIKLFWELHSHRVLVRKSFRHKFCIHFLC